jgi:hypothetical protein
MLNGTPDALVKENSYSKDTLELVQSMFIKYKRLNYNFSPPILLFSQFWYPYFNFNQF